MVLVKNSPEVLKPSDYLSKRPEIETLVIMLNQENFWVDRLGNAYLVNPIGHQEWASTFTDVGDSFDLEQAGWLHISQYTVYYRPKNIHTKWSRSQTKFFERWEEIVSAKGKQTYMPMTYMPKIADSDRKTKVKV